jgi:branched-chain amino acid transport system ATP-binding protein
LSHRAGTDDGPAVLLELRRIKKSFGAVTVADDLNLRVEQGEALGVIGPNGAGKTTLFGLISGAIVPGEGQVWLSGENVTGLSAERRCVSGIARSHQVPQPFDNLSVFENVLTAACFGQRKREQDVSEGCADILRRTGLLPKANRKAGSLTLLDRKRLEMARALATGPKLLLLDEIAGGLTEGECRELVGTIKEIHAQGVTIIWIEHIVHALLAVVSRLLVLNLGAFIASGDPQTVIASREVREIYMGSPV